jgi:hypothetical protein
MEFNHGWKNGEWKVLTSDIACRRLQISKSRGKNTVSFLVRGCEQTCGLSLALMLLDSNFSPRIATFELLT